MSWKMQSRSRIVMGVDDGYFPPAYKSMRGETLLVGVLMDEDLAIEDALVRRVHIDSRESTDAIIEFARLARPHVVLLDGITYAGFDVADPDKIREESGSAVIVIQQYPLNLERIRYALEKHFEDYNDRYGVIERVYSRMKYITTPWRRIQVYIVPDRRELVDEIKRYMIYSPVPEPLRAAHLLASNLSRGMHTLGLL